MVRRAGQVLLEVTAALVIVAFVSVSAAAVLQAEARNVRMLYEERLAWEVASGQLAVLEAARERAPREGTYEIALESPGWENLANGRCEATVAPVEPGVWRASVEVSWDGFRGARRSVAARTILAGAP